jgi:hypothetical protein
MAPKHPTTTSSEEPTTIWAWERRRRGLDETEAITDEIPKLPASSPWSVGLDEVSGPETAVDRSEDGATVTENQHG